MTDPLRPSSAAIARSDSGTDRLTDILAAACDISILVSGEGRILSVVPGMVGIVDAGLEDRVGQPLAATLTEESRPKLESALARAAAGETTARPVELNHISGDGREFPVAYRAVPFAEDGSLLLVGRDLGAIAETQTQLVQAQMSLEQSYEARREFDARYRMLLRTVRDPVIFVAASDGTVTDLNEPAAAALGTTREAFMGAALASGFADSDPAEFLQDLTNAAGGDGGRALTLRAAKSGRAVRLTAQAFRAAGERGLICRLSVDAAEETAGPYAADVGALFEKASDAILFATLRGEILSCNDAFLDLVNASQTSDVTGENMSGFLGRGRIDLNVMVENARRLGQMRLYATRLVTELGGSIPVEMSVTYLNDRTDPLLALVIRDASRSEAVRGTPVAGSSESARSVMELVGSASLKEIVAETTDVVEKMCIETAVHLTRNNRVAAAEMLGLSRQSLYVKLRKYDLLSRDADNAD